MERWCSGFTKKSIHLLIGESMFWLRWFDRLVLFDTAQAHTVRNQDWQVVHHREISLSFPLNQVKWKYLSSFSRNWFLLFSLMPQRNSHRCLKYMLLELVSFPILWELPKRVKISGSSWLQFWEGRTDCYLCGLKEKI